MNEKALAQGAARRLKRAKVEGIHPANTRLYDKQREFVYHPARMSAFVGGIGSGKTVAGCYKTLHFAKPQTLGVITAPSYGMLRDATVRTFKQIAGDYIAHITRSPPIECTLKNGAQILFRSAHEPELLRGPSIHYWWGDEAALNPKEVWQIMIGRLRADGLLGYAWLTTTPKGRNYIYQQFVARTDPDYVIFKAATKDNPFIEPAYYQMLAEAYQSGDFARQELDGDFVAFEGLIYWEFDRSVHISTGPRPASFQVVIAGVDWGYVHPGAIMVYGLDSDGRMWGLHEEYARNRRIEEWAAIAAELQQQYKIDFFVCDPSQPDYIAQFQRAGVSAREAVNDVLPGIQSVKNRLAIQGDGRPRLIFPPEFVNTASEMEQYQWATNQDGMQDKPKKVSDDALDCTRYASMAADAYFGINQLAGAMNYADYTSIGSGDY